MGLPLPHDPFAVDYTTDAEIEASDGGSRTVALKSIGAFSYSSNVLQMGDPFSITVPDPRGEYADALWQGWSITFSMSNPYVKGGSKTRKQHGIITSRTCSGDSSAGTVLQITGADLGWHLANNDALPWVSIRGSSVGDLVQWCIFPHSKSTTQTDPKWGFATDDPGSGFKGVRLDNAENSAIKRNVVFTAAERVGFLQTQMSGQPIFVQVQPGQRMSDLLIQWARRMGLLVNVSVDGYVQFFRPNYTQAPSYSIVVSRKNEGRQKTNVVRFSKTDSLDSMYTHVTVVGENPQHQLIPATGQVKTFRPQYGKLYGRAVPDNWPPNVRPLPFQRRVYMSDGEMVEKPDRRARWHQRRGLFDASSTTYLVRGHHQEGRWWESDTMAEVYDEVNNLFGSYYVSDVKCSRTMSEGDTTEVTIREPGLLDEITVNAP